MTATFQQQKLIQHFFDSSEHQYFWEHGYTDKLDEAFRAFFLDVKKRVFMQKTIHWTAVHYDKRERKHRDRFPLAVDTEEETSQTLFPAVTFTAQAQSFSVKLSGHIENPELYDIIQQRPEKEQAVLYALFVEESTTAETARAMNVSQQAVSKIKQKSLRILKTHLENCVTSIDK
ncbi:sigma-70 family RNA polymerase sigma factor [Marinococcus luteus]|uniref:sigma-70 family RNA polymerase sigma factor n=1 Tax=Marinococcus luteus TaxID=1122204 RepID=UPI002ACCAB60|nr:sigma-70 family RNA polymerase sigma factor [Marinococcus luteus]MDZ5784025.1 sigma-70 family RNA polymerase sigma factor [Marinococcus luteus]